MGNSWQTRREAGLFAERTKSDGSFFVVWGNMGSWWAWLGLSNEAHHKGKARVVGHQHGGMESLSGRSARDRNSPRERTANMLN